MNRPSKMKKKLCTIFRYKMFTNDIRLLIDEL